MGGPGCSIPLRQPADDSKLLDLRRWLWSVDGGKHLPPIASSPAWAWHVLGSDRYWSFGLRNWLGGDPDDIRPFSLGIHDTQTVSDIVDTDGSTDALGTTVTADDLRQELTEEHLQWLVQVGYYPAQRLYLEAHCNGTNDHCILAHIALGLAEQCDGLIDLSGALTPPVHVPPPDPNASLAEMDAHFDRVMHPPLENVHEYVHQLPGHVYEFYYTLMRGRQWVSHVMDLAAFRAWTHHPDFHMIK